MRFFVDQRTDFEKGAAFGSAGPYEYITTRVAADAGEGRAEILKPRDPARGNGTLVFGLAPWRANSMRPAAHPGFTFVSLDWKDGATRQAGVREVLAFLRVTGGPMLLGDQPRFLKRTVAIHGPWLDAFIAAGHHKDEKGRALIVGVVGGKVEGLQTLASIDEWAAPPN